MLVLTRKTGEEIVIGDPQNPIGYIRVARIHGGDIRLALDFDKSTEIHRVEFINEVMARQGKPQIRSFADGHSPNPVAIKNGHK